MNKPSSSNAVTISLVLSLALVCITVLLFIANRVPPQSKPELAVNPGDNPLSVMGSFVVTAEKELSADSLKKWNETKGKMSGDSYYNSAVKFWDFQKRPDIAAVFAGRYAESKNSTTEWNFAGERFYASLGFVKNDKELTALFNCAIRCFENALQSDSSNTNAKINLAACLVERSPDPMKGIGMLREIEKTDSNNVKLQLNFGFFSLRSQQFDKAERRFRKVIQLDSNYVEGYLHLAQALEANGKKEECIKMLEIFVRKTDNETMKATIKNYVADLKKEKD